MVLATLLAVLLIVVSIIEFRVFKRRNQLLGWLWWLKGTESQHNPTSQIMKSGSLRRYKPFRRAIFWPFFIALLVSISIVLGDNLSISDDFCTRSECWQQFVATFKVPISLLAISVPLGAWAVANHRAKLTYEQIKKTETQIAATEAQNRFANYFKHKEEFLKFISSEKEHEIHSPEKLHSYLYGGLTDFHYDGSDRLNLFLLTICDFISSIGDNNKALMNASLRDLLYHIDKSSVGSIIKARTSTGRKVVALGQGATSTKHNPALSDVLHEVYNIINSIEFLCDFNNPNVKKSLIDKSSLSLVSISNKTEFLEMKFSSFVDL